MRRYALIVAFIFVSFAEARAETLQLVAEGSSLVRPFGVDIGAGGHLYIPLMEPNQIRRIWPDGKNELVAGTGTKGHSGDGGSSLEATLNGPHHLQMANGHVFIADTWNNCIRDLDPKTLKIRAYAGTGVKGYSGDGGPAVKAEFGGIYCIAIDQNAERMYAADLDNRRVRMIDMNTRIVTTVAGNGQKGAPKDGDVAKDSPLQDPRAVAVNSKGDLYILERGGNCLRVVDSSGKIKTVAGSGKAGPCGDGGDALKVMMNGPKHLCCDLEDNVLIADTENHTILKFTPKDGKITRIAGTGKKGNSGIGGDPLKAELFQPHGVYVDRSGTIYIADSSNNRVLKIAK